MKPRTVRGPQLGIQKVKPGALVVETVHVEGITYQSRFVKCGKRNCKRCQKQPTHGPYWYAFTWSASGRAMKAHYVGKELPKLIDLADRPESKS
jgi:hypothetical protein